MSETSESESETNQKKSENRFHQTSKYGNELHPIHLKLKILTFQLFI